MSWCRSRAINTTFVSDAVIQASILLIAVNKGISIPVYCQADAHIKQMPTCPINLFPLSVSMLLFAFTQRKYYMLSAHNYVNAECTTEVRLLKYSRFGGTSYTQGGPHQRVAISSRLRQ